MPPSATTKLTLPPVALMAAAPPAPSGLGDLLAAGVVVADDWERLTVADRERVTAATAADLDRKSTRLNSSHVKISYAVFCLKKKKKQPEQRCDQVKNQQHPTHQ